MSAAQFLSQVFFGLPVGWPLHFTLHIFTQSLSSFRNTCPYHRNLFCCRTDIMSSNHSLSVNPLLGTLSCRLTSHIHLTTLFFAVEMPPHFPFLWAKSHFHATYYFTHNCWTVLLSLSMTLYPCWSAIAPTAWIYSIQFEFISLQLHQHLHLHSTSHLNNRT